MRSVEHSQSFCRAGCARGDITPPVGAYHRMWGAATHDRSTGVHRPLTATVLALRPTEPTDHGSAGAVLVGLDHCILEGHDVQALRRAVAEATSFAADAVVVCLSHTHGAGLMARDRTELPGGDLIAPYLDGLAGWRARPSSASARPPSATRRAGATSPPTATSMTNAPAGSSAASIPTARRMTRFSSHVSRPVIAPMT